ncbi:hypothetical protein SNEBB_001139 [Seison nebaliae]|nr:hypothetical protein SNEBB_001139 [Seison nebaliae]
MNQTHPSPDEKEIDDVKKKPSKVTYGPISKRSCTDVVCCVLLLVYMTLMVGIGLIAFTQGNPKQLLYPQNTRGEICGIGKQYGKPNLLYFDISQCVSTGLAAVAVGCLTPQICVEKCPTKNQMFFKTSNKSDLFCRDEAMTSGKFNKLSVAQLLKERHCASYTIETEPLYRRCVPKLIADLLNDKLVDIMNETMVNEKEQSITKEIVKNGRYIMVEMEKIKVFGEVVVKDLVSTIGHMAIFVVIGLLISFIWIVLMRWLAKPLVWISAVGVIIITGVGIYFCVKEYKFWQKSDYATDSINFSLQLAVLAGQLRSNPKTWLALAIILSIFIFIEICILIFLSNRIRIAIGLITEASKAVGHIMSTLAFPLLPFIFELAVIVYFFASTLYLMSSKKANYTVKNTTTIDIDFGGSNNSELYNIGCLNLRLEEKCKPDVFEDKCSNITNYMCAFDSFGFHPDNPLKKLFLGDHIKGGDEAYEKFMDFLDRNAIILYLLNLFGFFWLWQFVVAFGQMVLAGAFASWYFSMKKPQDIPALPVLTSFKRTFLYHMGTLAFGALILAIIKFIRVILNWIYSKVKGSTNPLAKAILCCCKCFFWCLEKFMKFLNRNVYIMTAIHGKSFCTSAKDAFSLIARNIVRCIVIDKVTDLILFVGKLMITGLIGCGAGFYFYEKVPSTFLIATLPQIRYPWVPLVVVIIITYMITTVFFSVYDMCVDTIFLCFLQDLDDNDGTPEKPYFMSKQLMDILGKKNKKDPKADDETENGDISTIDSPNDKKDS